ncbi:MAG: PA2779 family protein [Oceanospirillaceae bacterium]|nr:PA2779 family protein [Oceanospirillaceae bacterium]
MMLHTSKLLRSAVARILMGLMLLLPALAQAAPVSTSSLMAAEETLNVDAERQKLMSLIERDDVAEQLSALGVDSDDAKQRVADMSPAEVAELNQKIDELPAGSGVLGVIVLIFIVFIITDAIGATNVFSFVHPVR